MAIVEMGFYHSDLSPSLTLLTESFICIRRTVSEVRGGENPTK